MQIVLSAVISIIISIIILNCGESIKEWMEEKFEDAKKWLGKKRK